jgi:NhaP-type Na+/H+ and K+/H+ antiporter
VSTTLAAYFVVFGALLLVAVLLDDVATRLRVPGILLVLLLGLLTENHLDSTLVHREHLLNLDQANEIAQVALVLVLFFGGLTSNWGDLRSVLRPAARLATLGSLITALIITAAVLGVRALPVTALHPSLAAALFVGAMLCSTDASAVLVVLRPLADRLPRRLIDLIECESGFNDPVAVILAGVALAMATGEADTNASQLVTAVARQFLIGALLGFLGGGSARQLLSAGRSRSATALFVVMSLAVLFLLVGGTQLLGGSGLLAAYIAGLVLGNGPEADRVALEEAHQGFAKLAELLLFLCLGLVVQADQVVESLPWALVLFLIMQLARWLMVETLLLRTGFGQPEKLMITAAGIRGAVPIALALQAAASGVRWGMEMPPLALAVVLLGLLLQGFSLVPLARRLGLASTG